MIVQAATLLLASVSAQDRTADDIAVFKAVLDQKVRPEAEQFAPKDRPPGVLPLIVSDRTLSRCGPEGAAIPAFGCILRDTEQALDFGRAITPAVREEFRQALVTRNTVSVAFPIASVGEVIPISPEKRAEVLKATERRTRGFASFALPAYASNGQAVVFARYTCGGLCGIGWYFLLDRSPAGWRVVAQRVVEQS